MYLPCPKLADSDSCCNYLVAEDIEAVINDFDRRRNVAVIWGISKSIYRMSEDSCTAMNVFEMEMEGASHWACLRGSAEGTNCS